LCEGIVKDKQEGEKSVIKYWLIFLQTDETNPLGTHWGNRKRRRKITGRTELNRKWKGFDVLTAAVMKSSIVWDITFNRLPELHPRR
jgi:hypothetical protein